MRIDLLRGEAAAVTYDDGGDLDRVLSPRPFLTGTTRSGAGVTEVTPADHRHHLGLSLALPDVNGVSFWGGRTFRRDAGSVLLDNHGIQRVDEREVDASGGRLVETLTWLDHRDATVLAETRTITATETAEGWDLTWRSRLCATAGDVTFGSPQTNGRDGAFYGGLFWRTPFERATVRTHDGAGIAAAHGSLSSWLAIDGPHASVVAATTTAMPWFVRDTGYVGFGPAVAVTERRRLAAGDTLDLTLAVAVMDAPSTAPDQVGARLLSGILEAV
ncbi:PmoA family protein [Microbacterium sp. Sa4CUA7]|uniref:PmoA family protein n=1 Tax=Microbacterium pullorum TaxID=2762236 RepID=A0ABR8RZ41_9MICO|nr:PmoA family protein [Microbacterium pullorum]MBD7956499.1 PmoA family protein [Microbacterium pullorum]